MNFITQYQANTTANIVDTTSFLLSFKAYMITLEGVFPSSTTTSPLLFQVISSTSAGLGLTTTYLSATSLNNAGTGTGLVNTGGVQIGSTLQAPASPGISGFVYVMDPAQTAASKMVWAQTGGQSATPTGQMVTASGYWNGATTAVVGFRLIFGSTAAVVNVSSGIVRVYGINTV